MVTVLSSGPRRMNRVEWIVLAIYLLVTAYVFVCASPPQIAIALRQAVFPFQIRARGRIAAAELNASAWYQYRVQILAARGLVDSRSGVISIRSSS